MKDVDTFMAWINLSDKYAPQEISNLIQLFTGCKMYTLENKDSDVLNTLHSMISELIPRYKIEKQ